MTRILACWLALLTIVASSALVACGGSGDDSADTAAASVPTQVFSEYGIAFEYPGDFEVEATGVITDEADETSGVVTAESKDRMLNVFWMSTFGETLAAEDLERGLDQFFQSLSMRGWDSVERGDAVSTTLDGQSAVYAMGTGRFDGDEASFGTAMGQCESELVITVGVVRIGETVEQVEVELQKVLSSFRC